jgi:DNA processing protein
MARHHVALLRVPGVGGIAVGRLLTAFPEAEGAFRADAASLRRLGLSERQAAAIHAFRDFEEADRVLERARALGQTVVAFNDPAYPAALRTLDDPPPVVFLRGAWTAQTALAVTIVGTRNPTAYGENVAYRLGAALAKAGICTVSGGARGIDACAHRGALAADGRTVAVVGTGLDIVYPPEHVGLFAQIVEAGGALLSELPPGSPPHRGSFPARNRLMAALGRSLVVVEAGERSGALITARQAAEQGKTVLAAPGPIDRAQSRGTNRLIRDGAKPLLEILDVVEETLGEHLKRGFAEDEALAAASRPPAPAGEPGEVWRALAAGPADTDALVEKTGLNAARVNAALLELELTGRARRRPGNIYEAATEE